MEKVEKHWGTYEVISQNDRSKVKILEVNPDVDYHYNIIIIEVSIGLLQKELH